jgi:hypothetical protein
MTIPYAHMKSAKPRNNIEQILQCFNAEGQKDLIAIDNETLHRIFTDSSVSDIVEISGDDIRSTLEQITFHLLESNQADKVALMIRTSHPNILKVEDMTIILSFIQKTFGKDCKVWWGYSSLKTQANPVTIIIACSKM